MFWKILRWGGTIAILLIVAAAVMQGPGGEDPAAPKPVVNPEPNKNFNL